MESQKPASQHTHHPKYLLVFASLALLTAIEVAITYIPAFKPVLTPILLALSFLKAMLVILYFMHLRFDSRWFAFIFFIPFVLVLPMLLVVLLS